LTVDRFSLAAARQFSTEKMRKSNLAETERLFCDLYCLEPGQAQRPHRHDASDKIYIVLEGRATAIVGTEQADLGAGEGVLAPAGLSHGLHNATAERAVVLVFMAPKP
jgi:mannose-6-phosphate isomerase-like protein (cupin superfamily)